MICDFEFAKESEEESHSSHGMGFECSLLIYIFFLFFEKGSFNHRLPILEGRRPCKAEVVVQG